jgi:hypothetical protein
VHAQYDFVRAHHDQARRRALPCQDALRADLHARRELTATEPFETLVFDGNGSRALVDINDNRALQDLMDEEGAGGRG